MVTIWFKREGSGKKALEVSWPQVPRVGETIQLPELCGRVVDVVWHESRLPVMATVVVE